MRPRNRHFDRSRLILPSCGLALLALTAGRLEAAPEISWALHERGCMDGSSTLEITCGDYGAFHFVNINPPPGCTAITAGSEVPPHYSLPGNMQAFPVTPMMFEGEIVIHPVQAGAVTNPPASDVTTMSRPEESRPSVRKIPSLPSNPGDRPWNAVIDFDDPHGWSTTWLVEEISGQRIDTVLIPLDDPDLSSIGEVGDFHVLAKLCSIAEQIDIGGVEPPLTINMSFGRGGEAGDAEDDTGCDATRASCQIAKVAQHLRDRGASLVAASGNHQQLLFPATLRGVLAVGMLELNDFLKRGTAGPAWETPTESRGWLPGNGLCLDDWAAPAGSSYSSAILSGWLSSVLDEKGRFDTLRGGGRWMPRWHGELGCYVLARGRQVAPWCNEAMTTIFDGLLGANRNACWSAAVTPVAEAYPSQTAQSQPAIPSFDSWVTETHPTPESDPCIPCVGYVLASFGSSSDLMIDFSQSVPLDDDVYLDSVFLRDAGNFYPLFLQPQQLQAIQDGTLAQLVLPGWGSLFSGKISLWYQLRDQAFGSCPTTASCYWSSTPVLTAF